ncbi:increased recombination centers protein 19 [[Candida] anglica]|uniref:Increased recombination centers protein 19 n=1 Tax=[Candida] anglica TaxID=148631 RepID=A0ABP0EAC3_9ASCO
MSSFRGYTVAKRAVLVANKSVTVSMESLQGLTYKQQLLSLYKRFYRLRVYQTDAHDLKNYSQLLRRKFTTEKFSLKRQIFLPTDESISPEQLVRRAVNTLEFVQNSVVFNDTPENQNFIKGTSSKPYEPRVESKVLSTILSMEGRTDTTIKCDPNYRWMSELEDKILSKISSTEENELEYKKTFRKHESTMSYLGYRDYNQNLIRFNECFQLCL